jgi:hypothetical protein
MVLLYLKKVKKNKLEIDNFGLIDFDDKLHGLNKLYNEFTEKALKQTLID